MFLHVESHDPGPIELRYGHRADSSTVAGEVDLKGERDGGKEFSGTPGVSLLEHSAERSSCNRRN